MGSFQLVDRGKVMKVTVTTMRNLIIVLMVYMLAGCPAATVNPEPFVGPSGKPAYSMRCSGFGRTWASCYQSAGELCPNGYKIVDQASGTIAIPVSGGGFLAAPKQTLVIECVIGGVAQSTGTSSQSIVQTSEQETGSSSNTTATTTLTWEDGTRYVGEVLNNLPHGHGTITSDGAKYIGEFKDGKMHGQGTYTWPDGNKYVGEHKDGDKHGQGTYTFADGRTDSGEWRNGQLVSKKGLEETQPKAQSSVNEDEQENRSTEESFVTQSKATDVKSLYSANNDDEIYIFFGRSSSDVRKHLERNYLKDCTLKAGEFSVCDTRFFDRSKQSQFFVETRGVGGVTVQRIHGFQGENYLGLKVHISGVSKFLLAAIDQQVRRVKTQRLDLQVLLETPNSGEVILWFGHDLEALNDSLFDYDKPAGS